MLIIFVGSRCARQPGLAMCQNHFGTKSTMQTASTWRERECCRDSTTPIVTWSILGAVSDNWTCSTLEFLVGGFLNTVHPLSAFDFDFHFAVATTTERAMASHVCCYFCVSTKRRPSSEWHAFVSCLHFFFSAAWQNLCHIHWEKRVGILVIARLALHLSAFYWSFVKRRAWVKVSNETHASCESENFLSCSDYVLGSFGREFLGFCRVGNMFSVIQQALVCHLNGSVIALTEAKFSIF